MEQKFKLELIGITYNQIESGVYAMILQQVGTTRRIPIIIGLPEAQAIECKLQEIRTPRPLTHDILVRSLEEFGIHLDHVLIKRLPNGVFAADIHLSDGVSEKVIDTRSSDAVALAIRTNAPIYTTEDVILEASFDPSDKNRREGKVQDNPDAEVKPSEAGLSALTMDQLQKAMNEAAEKEDYEQAALIKEEINKRKNPPES